MPKFTIESTFRVPHYRHTTYEAASFEEACKMAMEDQDWDHQKADYDSSGAEHITGAWEGEDSAYSGPALAIPADLADDLTPEQRAAPVMLAALQYVDSVAPAQPGDGSSPLKDDELVEIVITGKALLDIRAAIAAAEGR